MIAKWSFIQFIEKIVSMCGGKIKPKTQHQKLWIFALFWWYVHMYHYSKWQINRTDLGLNKVQCRHLIPALNAPGQNIRPHAWLPLSFLGMDAWLTSQLKVVLIQKLLRPLICLAKYFEMLFMDVYTSRHMRTSGRLVHELNVCTVSLYPRGMCKLHVHVFK